MRGTSPIPFAAAAVLATLATLTPRATLAFDRPESLDALLSVVAPDTKKACEDSGGVWVTLTDEEKKTVAAYCDLSPAITNTSWSSETESGMSWESVAARANSLARFYDGRLGTAKSAFVATRELTVGTTLADAIIARLAAANAADLKLKSADAQKRVAVREQALVAWRRTRVAITRVEEEWKKRAGAAKKP